MKALGITAMVIAIISIFVPVVGVYLTFITAAMAAFAAGGGFVFGSVALGVNVVNLLFLSPLLWVAASVQQGTENEGGAIGLGIFLVVSQVIAFIFLFRKNKRLTAQAPQAPQVPQEA